MPITRKPLEIPPDVARQFAAKMQAFHGGRNILNWYAERLGYLAAHLQLKNDGKAIS